MNMREAMELVKAGKAIHHLVMLDKDGEITENEDEMEQFREAVFSLEGELIIEACGRKPTQEELEYLEEHPELIERY